jgi:hypothetical protein
MKTALKSLAIIGLVLSLSACEQTADINALGAAAGGTEISGVTPVPGATSTVDPKTGTVVSKSTPDASTTTAPTDPSTKAPSDVMKDPSGNKYCRDHDDDDDDKAEAASQSGTLTSMTSSSSDSTNAAEGNEKLVLICHKHGQDKSKEMSLLVSMQGALNGHIKHGDSFGACADTPTDKATHYVACKDESDEEKDGCKKKHAANASN